EFLRQFVTHETLRWTTAADDDDVAAVGHFSDRAVEHFVYGRCSGQLVIVIQNQQRRASEVLAKEMPTETREIGPMFGSKQRQGCRILRAGGLRLRQVIEEGPDVVVAPIQVIPRGAA